MKKVILIFSLILFVLLISGCNPPQQPPQTQEGLGTLTGKVYGNVPNTVIYRAEVIAEGGGKTYKTSTDKSGIYVLHLPAGTYNVTVNMETFNSETKSVNISTNQTKTQDFTLTTGTTSGPAPQYSLSRSTFFVMTMPTSLDMKIIDIKALKEKKIDKVIGIDKSLNSKNVNKITGGVDYASYIVLYFAEPVNSIPWGIKGFRVYVSESGDGPYALLGAGSMDSNVVGDGIKISSLEPYKTYYCRVTEYGDFGESELTGNPIPIQTPKPLVLVSPENNVQVFSPVNFVWESLGDGFTYEGPILVFDTNFHEIEQINTTQTFYQLNLPYGSYYWYLEGWKYETDDNGINKEQVSMSYFRSFNMPAPAGPNLIQNGDFSNGELTPWEVLLININNNFWSVDAGAKVLHWVRGNSNSDGGYVGTSQSLNIDTTGKTKVVLSLDVVIYYQELDSDGWAGGEYPARVSIFFANNNGDIYEYKKCFILEGSTIHYPGNNVTSISKDTWYHFEVNLMDDSNVASQIQSHPYIKEIRVGGNGWDFEGAADNIYLGVQ
jgi:hypothetical protein